jgi:hypothetical protein
MHIECHAREVSVKAKSARLETVMEEQENKKWDETTVEGREQYKKSRKGIIGGGARLLGLTIYSGRFEERAKFEMGAVTVEINNFNT